MVLPLSGLDRRPEALQHISPPDPWAHRTCPRVDSARLNTRPVVDYKTTSTTPNEEKVSHTHETQTSIYAVLYRETNGQRELGIELHSLVKLKNPKLSIIELPSMTDSQQTRLFHLLEAYVEGLERRDFVPSPGLSCMSCEFFNECRRWK